MVNKNKAYTSKSPTRRAKGAIVGLWLHLVAAAAYGAATAWQLSFLFKLDPDTTLPADFLGSESPGFVLGFALSAMIYAASLPIHLVLFLMWVHRTNRNAHVLAPSFDMSPAWGVGWFFVPIACLAKPFEGVEKTWNISTDPTRWRSQDTPALLRVWWGLYLSSNVIGWLANIVSQERTVKGHLAAGFLTIIAAGLIIGYSVAAIRIVRTLTARQVANMDAAAFS